MKCFTKDRSRSTCTSLIIEGFQALTAYMADTSLRSVVEEDAAKGNVLRELTPLNQGRLAGIIFESNSTLNLRRYFGVSIPTTAGTGIELSINLPGW